MRRIFTPGQDAAMEAVAALLVELGFTANGRTVSKRVNGVDVGGGALKFTRGQVQRATVGPNWSYLYCSEEGQVYSKLTFRTAALEGQRKVIERWVVPGLPPPVSARTSSYSGGRYREGTGGDRRNPWRRKLRTDPNAGELW